MVDMVAQSDLRREMSRALRLSPPDGASLVVRT